MVHPFVSAPNFVSVTPSMEYPRYKIQFAKHMKLKRREGQSVDTSFFLRMGNKIPMEGVAEFAAS